MDHLLRSANLLLTPYSNVSCHDIEYLNRGGCYRYDTSVVFMINEKGDFKQTIPRQGHVLHAEDPLPLGFVVEHEVRESDHTIWYNGYFLMQGVYFRRSYMRPLKYDMKYVEKYLCDDAHYSHMISFEQQEGDAIVMPNFWCFSSRFAAQRYVHYITVFFVETGTLEPRQTTA